jgi:putative acetyltransferase
MIRKAEISEFVILFDIWESSVRASHDFISESDFQLIKREVVPEGFELVELYVYISDLNQIEGFLGVLDNKIEMLFIKPDMRSKGIGKNLLFFAIEELHCTLVDVNEQNTPAFEFYLHFGFRVCGRTEKDPMGLPYPILALKIS